MTHDEIQALGDAELDLAVAKAEWFMRPRIESGVCVVDLPDGHPFSPSTDWSLGGSIIERERVDVIRDHLCQDWVAYAGPHAMVRASAHGPTPLIAAMRAFVASKQP